jgi:3-oxoacyl-[acyl-carrier protein] reductase
VPRSDTRGVAVISGGLHGIGRSTVIRLARDGFDVSFCHDGDESALREVERAAAEAGARTLATRVDVSDHDAVQGWIARTEQLLGPVAVAVTTAGVVRDRPLASMADEDWTTLLDTNLKGVHNVCRTVVCRMMKRNAGAVVAVSAVAEPSGHATHIASKMGTVGFCQALAVDLDRYGVRINVLVPGLGRPEEVAELASRLVSDHAWWVTGAVVHVD